MARARTRCWRRRRRRCSTRPWRDGIAAELKSDDMRDRPSRAVAAMLDLSGAMYLSRARRAARGRPAFREGLVLRPARQMLPPYDTRETLAARWRSRSSRYRPATVIALGDSFHDHRRARAARRRRPRRARQRCSTAGDWIWVTGNHDRALPPAIGGEVVEELALGALDAAPRARRRARVREIAGHLHPVGKVVMRGRAVRRRCFVTDGERCIMPALGAYAGGLNACDPAFRRFSRKGSPPISSAKAASSPSPRRCCAGIERSEACPAYQPRRWRNATIF